MTPRIGAKARYKAEKRVMTAAAAMMMLLMMISLMQCVSCDAVAGEPVGKVLAALGGGKG
jgi:hypothetical protein